MTKRFILYVFISFFIAGAMISCNSNKIPCPTYADSQPEKKKKTKPGEQKPEIPHASKAKSGVMPSDGGGKRTKLPK